MALTPEDKADVKGAMGKAIANKVSKVTKDKDGYYKGKLKAPSGKEFEITKPRTITLKSGEEIIAGKKYRSPRADKPLKSWGDDLPRMGASKSKALQGKKGTTGSKLTPEQIADRVKNWNKTAGKNHDIMGS